MYPYICSVYLHRDNNNHGKKSTFEFLMFSTWDINRLRQGQFKQTGKPGCEADQP